MSISEGCFKGQVDKSHMPSIIGGAMLQTCEQVTNGPLSVITPFIHSVSTLST